jgi:AmiR/NasT family two-component response regulator
MKPVKRVAVADDEPIMQMYLQEVLTDFGYEVTTAAEDGNQLVENCRACRPDLVVTDIKMPRMDGIQAVQEIYRDGPLPVVFITGYNDRERVDDADANFVLVYLVKPVGEEQLREAVDQAVRRFQEFQIVQRECTDSEQALQEWRFIEQAKAVLMGKEGLTEPDAFERLVAAARECQRRIYDAALEHLSAD